MQMDSVARRYLSHRLQEINSALQKLTQSELN